MVDLEALSQAYRRAARVSEDAERVAAEQMRLKRQAKSQARETLALGMVQAWRDGVTQTDIAHRTGYSREQVRRILRAHGVEPGE